MSEYPKPIPGARSWENPQPNRGADWLEGPSPTFRRVPETGPVTPRKKKTKTKALKKGQKA
jgi:hypothetical protein